MAYNFKSIADVEVVAEPTESANVLIEENGVIKKAPKTAVGGAGETIMIVFNSDNWSEEYNGYEIISAPDNLYEIAKEMLESFTYHNIIMCNYNEEYGQKLFAKIEQVGKNDDSYWILFDNYYCANIYPDGTISIGYWD